MRALGWRACATVLCALISAAWTQSRGEQPDLLSCHGSRYDNTGKVTNGPAPNALPRLLTVEDGVLAIDVARSSLRDGGGEGVAMAITGSRVSLVYPPPGFPDSNRNRSLMIFTNFFCTSPGEGASSCDRVHPDVLPRRVVRGDVLHPGRDGRLPMCSTTRRCRGRSTT